MIWPPRPEGHTPDKTGAPWEPWLTREAIEILDRTLTRETKLFEFGSGGSTLWYSQRCLFVDSIEHDSEWLRFVSRMLVHYQLRNTCVFYGSSDNTYADYLDFASHILGKRGPKFGPYDVVVVDGRCRVKSVRLAAPHIHPGGLLVLDNAERPWYAEVRSILSGWSVQETSNGIWRTDFFRKL